MSNDLRQGDVVETDFSGTRTVHTVANSRHLANGKVLVKVKPVIVESRSEWIDASWFKKVEMEVREIEQN